jgi:hypothetical protein
MTTTSTATVSPIAQIKALHHRLLKGEELVANGKVSPVVNMPDHYVVEGNAGFYLVNGSCCCEDATNRQELIRGYCKHRLAVELFKETPKATGKAIRKAKAEVQEVAPETVYEVLDDLEAKINDLYR